MRKITDDPIVDFIYENQRFSFNLFPFKYIDNDICFLFMRGYLNNVNAKLVKIS